MSTTKTRRQPPSVSATVQKLLSQVQAEAQQALLDELSAKDGVTVLQPLNLAGTSPPPVSDGLIWYGRDGSQISLYRRRQFPESWGDWMCPHWHPSYIDVSVTQRDGQGRKWQCSLGNHITDDFGTLVCIEGGVA